MDLRNRQSGTFLRHVPCPECGSSDANALYKQADDTVDSTCFSCGHYDPSPAFTEIDESPKRVSNVKEMLSVSELVKCPTLAITDRGITESTSAFYGVRTLLGNGERAPLAYLFPYYHTPSEVAFKYRDATTKSFRTIGPGKGLGFFGQHLFASGGKRLYVTEGEIDALSLFQVLKSLSGAAYKHLDPPVVSLPNGARSAAKVFAEQSSFLSKFDEIILAFDQDDEGKKAVELVASISDPSRIKTATFSEKDANDMLLAGKEKELKWSVVTNAVSYTPSGIATVSDLAEQALQPPTMGRPWPFPTLTQLTYGRRPGVYLLGAGVGVGKTEFFHEVGSHIVAAEGKPVGVFLFEEAPARTIKTLAGKMIGKNPHLPDAPISDEELRNAIQLLSEPSNLVFTFDHKWDRDWSSVFTQIKHLIQTHGVRDIFIDPLTALISHVESTDRSLHAIMDDISTLAQDPYNASVYVSSHLNEPPRDKTPHEEGGRVKESQFAGSRAMIRYSNYVLGLERNKQDEDPFQRTVTTVRILKDRDFGSATGETFDIAYDLKSGLLKETSTTLEF